MSNIHSISDRHFQENQHLTSPLAQIDPIQIDSYPEDLDINFWSRNLTTEISFWEQFLFQFCPCFQHPLCSEERKNTWVQFFFSITFLLIVTQIILFSITLHSSDHIYGFLEPSVDALLEYGAIANNFQIWRIFMYMFLHGNLFHILINTLAQIKFSIGAEKRWGVIKYVIIYFVGGVIGGLFSRSECGVGASGAILSTMGSFVSLILIYYTRSNPFVRHQMLIWLASFGIMFILISSLPHVDFLGHLGGLIGGFGIGLVLFRSNYTLKWQKWGVLTGCIIVLLSILIPLYYKIY